jgi:hypothetical protein
MRQIFEWIAAADDDGPKMLLFSVVPRENLIKDDGAESCGVDSSDREDAGLECEVAGPCRKCNRDGDQISWVGEIDLVLSPDPTCHGGDQAKQHDRQAADDGTRDRKDKSAEFWREAEHDRDDGSNDKQKSRIDPCHRHYTDGMRFSRGAVLPQIWIRDLRPWPVPSLARSVLGPFRPWPVPRRGADYLDVYLEDGPFDIENYFLNVETHEEALRSAGFCDVRWHQPMLSPQGASAT